MNKFIKNFSILAVVAASFAAQAQQADVYERLGTAGEYPIAYKTTQSLTVKLRKAPTSLLKADENCRLDAKTDIKHATLQKTIKVGKYRYKQAQTVELGDGKLLKIAAGEIVEDMSYFAEGFCDVRVKGQILENSCFGNGGADDDQKETVQELEQ